MGLAISQVPYTRSGSHELFETAGEISVFELPSGPTLYYWEGGNQSRLVTIGPDQSLRPARGTRL